MKSKYCPECNEPLLGNHCGNCGWGKVVAKSSSRPCSYSDGSNNCPLPATIFAKGFMPYCRFHYRTKDSPEKSQQILYGLMNDDIVIEKRNWRDIMVDEAMIKLKKESPEFFVKPQDKKEHDELWQLHYKRMKAMISNFGTLPYDKTKNLAEKFPVDDLIPDGYRVVT